MVSSCRSGVALGAVAVVGLALSPQGHAAEPLPRRLTLEQSIEEALARSPVLGSRRSGVEQAEGRLVSAATYPFNPELSLEAARRTGGDPTTDREIRLGQEIEIGGKRGRRVAEARAVLDASRAGRLREERLLSARVCAAFVEALRARELRDVEVANAELARALAEVARKRLDAGAVAQMEVNLARVQVGRAARDLSLAEGAYEVARSMLAAEVGLDPAQPPEIDGALILSPRRFPPLAEILEQAMEHRADLKSFRSATDAARSRIEVARRVAIPNLEVETFYGREGGSERLLGGGIQVRIPIFNRNQGEIAEARAAHRQASADTQVTGIKVRREVAASLARYRAFRDASLNLQDQVLGTLAENLRLLQRSFEAGKTDWTEVLVFRREFVDVRRDYIDTVAGTLLAGIELDLASGVAPRVNTREARP